MRVTTQMLWQNSKRAGMLLNSTSLLDILNKSGSSNVMISSMTSSNSNVLHRLQKIRYEDLEESASNLSKTAHSLAGEKNVFTKEEVKKEEVYDYVDDLVRDYNATLEDLKKNYSPLNQFYREELQKAVTESKVSLDEIGITQGTDGELKLDKEKMKVAEVATIQKVLGSDSKLGKKLTFIAERVADNAKANVENITSQYNSTGDSYSQLSNKYNFWG